MRAVSSIIIAFFLILLVMGLMLAAYYIEGPMLAGQKFSSASQLKITAQNDYLNITNTGYAPVTITSVLVRNGNTIAFYNYSAVILPGQSVSIYIVLKAGDVAGVETDGGVVWST